MLMIVTTLCMKVLVVKLTVIGRFLKKKVNCMLLGLRGEGYFEVSRHVSN